MTNYICATCGVQYGETDAPSEHCLICEDERQYIGQKGQRWTTIPELQAQYHNRVEDIDANLINLLYEKGYCQPQDLLGKLNPLRNHYYILKSGKKSALAYYNPFNGMLEHVEKRSVYGIKPLMPNRPLLFMLL